MTLLVIPEEPAADTTPAAHAHAHAPRAERLRLGTLDNSKSNADHLLARLVQRIGEARPVVSVLARRKPGAALAAQPSVLDELAREADCVLVAMAD